MESARLASISLFADLGAENLDAVAEAAVEVEVPEGEEIVVEGDFGHALFVIESGTADVSVGGEQVRTLGPGDVFGEIAVVATGRRTATVVATSPMRLIGLFKRHVWALEQNEPAAASRLRELVDERRQSQTQ